MKKGKIQNRLLNFFIRKKKRIVKKQSRHSLDCIRKYLFEEGDKLFNKENVNEFERGTGHGLLSVLDLLEGTNNALIKSCICSKKDTKNKGAD